MCIKNKSMICVQYNHLSYIGKEKDVENNLGDHASTMLSDHASTMLSDHTSTKLSDLTVRKYDYETG